MSDEYLVFWDIDWTMYTRKLPEDIEDKIHNSKIEDILLGEFDIEIDGQNLKTPDLDEVMEKLGNKRQGVISNGITDHQYKKLKGFGVIQYLNPCLIMISLDQAKQDMEKAHYKWNELTARSIYEKKRKEEPLEDLADTKEFAYLRKWNKPSIQMIYQAVDNYVVYYQKTHFKDIKIEPSNVFLIGDREWDMTCILEYGGRGIHVKSPNQDELTSVPENQKERVREVGYEDFPQIPNLIEMW